MDSIPPAPRRGCAQPGDYHHDVYLGGYIVCSNHVVESIIGDWSNDNRVVGDCIKCELINKEMMLGLTRVEKLGVCGGILVVNEYWRKW